MIHAPGGKGHGLCAIDLSAGCKQTLSPYGVPLSNYLIAVTVSYPANLFSALFWVAQRFQRRDMGVKSERALAPGEYA
jgi:hypothetical protein